MQQRNLKIRFQLTVYIANSTDKRINGERARKLISLLNNFKRNFSFEYKIPAIPNRLTYLFFEQDGANTLGEQIQDIYPKSSFVVTKVSITR